jgi:hypothetical protein
LQPPSTFCPFRSYCYDLYCLPLLLSYKTSRWTHCTGPFFSSFQNLLKTDSTKQVGIFSFGLVYGYYSQAYPTMPITFWALQVSFQPFQVCLQTTELAWPNDQFHTKTKTRLRQRFFFFHYYFASRWKCKCIYVDLSCIFIIVMG